ncbi:MAG: hypothetical protein WBJ13_14225 [Sedimentibacter sp.]
MKKRGFKAIAASAVVGCLLLSVSVTAFATSGSGYESYKDAVKSTMLTENATVDAQFEVKDNGAIILSGNSIQKLDKESSSSKSNINIDGTTKTYETSEAAGSLIVKADDAYYSAVDDKKDDDNKKDEKKDFSANSSTVKLAEMLTDTIVGDVRNQFVTDGQNISVNLEGAQIPELARLAVSAVAENTDKVDKNISNEGGNLDESMTSIMNTVPKLTNIDVKSISMNATVDGNTLKNNEFTIVITGNDADGVSHELSFLVSVEISNVGNTVIDTIDTNGKEVKALDFKGQHGERD